MEEKENYSFEISFYEALDHKDPSDGRVLEILAQIYTKVGRSEDGLSVDIRLSKLRPEDSLVHYNLACSLALVGQSEDAVMTLKKSITLGYRDYEWMMKDEDLDSVRDLPSYHSLIEELNF